MASLYPLVNFRFTVAIGDATNRDAAFSEVSGLDTDIATETIDEGGENVFSHTVPTRATHGNLILKRGLLDAKSALFQWCKTTMENGLGKPLVPQDITVSLLDGADTPILSWTLASCWPVKMKVGTLDAKNGDVAIETLEFAYASLTRTYE